MSESTTKNYRSRIVVLFDDAGGCDIKSEGGITPYQLLGAASVLRVQGEIALGAQVAEQQARVIEIARGLPKQ